jgi:hypothetical protein
MQLQIPPYFADTYTAAAQRPRKMAKVLNIADGERFRLRTTESVKLRSAPLLFGAAPLPATPLPDFRRWNAFENAITSPFAVVVLFVLFLVACVLGRSAV